MQCKLQTLKKNTLLQPKSIKKSQYPELDYNLYLVCQNIIQNLNI